MAPATSTLYAQWTPTYNVTYNGNGFTGGSVPTDANNYTNGQIVTVLGNSGNLTRTGYIYSAWSNISGTILTNGQTFAMGGAGVTLYATWTPTYNVTYSGNGSTGGTAPNDANNYTNNQLVTVLGNTGTLVRAGYVYLGWNTAANGSGTTYIGGATFHIAAAVTLYALWNPLYSVTYNANGATSGNAPTDPNTYTNGQTVTALSNTGSLD